MLYGSAIGEHVLDSLVHRTTSSQHFRARRIGAVVHTDDNRHGGTRFRLVGKPHLEYGRLTHWHIADNRGLDINLRN